MKYPEASDDGNSTDAVLFSGAGETASYLEEEPHFFKGFEQYPIVS